ncbi:MAG: amino acid ABC transporter permease [Erysipelotrichaceae bacterium]|nr:amino acid ABC transporter permease [Erysipelotrichaceae bacterium]
MNDFVRITLQLAKGFGSTLELFALTLLLAIPLGLFICFGSRSSNKVISALFRGLVWVIRGTPLMLQLIVVFFGPGLMFGISGFDRFEAVLFAFVINYACYFSEIYRGGIDSIDIGQYEAGKVLGLSDKQIFFNIILLQVIKRIIPPMTNEIITLVKDTSLARTISIYEITWVGQSFIKSEGLIWPLFYTGIFYLVFNGILTIASSKLEQKLDYFR